MTIYDELRAEAQALINEFGGDAFFERRQKVYNAETRQSTETLTSFNVRAVLVSPLLKAATDTRGETVKRFRYAIVGSENEIKPGDTLLMAGVRYPIVGITPIAPDGSVIVYRCSLGEG